MTFLITLLRDASQELKIFNTLSIQNKKDNSGKNASEIERLEEGGGGDCFSVFADLQGA